MSALTWDPERSSIEGCATCSVFDDTVDMWAPILGTAALFQNSAAHSRAHALTEVVGGRPAQSTHPSSGERPEMDSILDGHAEWAATVG